MVSEPVPTGRRFSQLYLSTAELLPDSKRMRVRLGNLIGTTRLSKLGPLVASEFGLHVPDTAKYPSFWPSFCEKAELRDVLDLITLRFQSLGDGLWDQSDLPKEQKEYVAGVRRILTEERVRYRVDDAGGVHFAVDSEFERSRIATLAALGKARYASARKSFEDAFLAMDATPPDGKAAIRSVFFAAEGLFRLIYSSAPQLNGGEVLKHLKPKVDALYADQKPAIYVAQKQVSAFKEWIDGAHFYRHEPGTEEPSQPPLELAVYMVSQGAAHIRWLAKFDLKNN